MSEQTPNVPEPTFDADQFWGDPSPYNFDTPRIGQEPEPLPYTVTESWTQPNQHDFNIPDQSLPPVEQPIGWGGQSFNFEVSSEKQAVAHEVGGRLVASEVEVTESLNENDVLSESAKASVELASNAIDDVEKVLALKKEDINLYATQLPQGKAAMTLIKSYITDPSTCQPHDVRTALDTIQAFADRSYGFLRKQEQATEDATDSAARAKAKGMFMEQHVAEDVRDGEPVATQTARDNADKAATTLSSVYASIAPDINGSTMPHPIVIRDSLEAAFTYTRKLLREGPVYHGAVDRMVSDALALLNKLEAGLAEESKRNNHTNDLIRTSKQHLANLRS